MESEATAKVCGVSQADSATPPKRIDFIWKTGIPHSIPDDHEFRSEILISQPYDGTEWWIACSELDHSSWELHLCCNDATAERIERKAISGKFYKKTNDGLVFYRPIYYNIIGSHNYDTPEKTFIGYIQKSFCKNGTEIEVQSILLLWINICITLWLIFTEAMCTAAEANKRYLPRQVALNCR